MKRMICAALALCALVLSSPAFAQQTTGNITGRITDDQNAAIPGVTVTGKNTETGFVRTGVTDGEGIYRLTALPVGTYDITAELQGFSKIESKGIVLNVGQTLDIPVTLKVATLAESVEVRGETPLIERTSSSVGGVVDVERMESLPLNGRQFANAAITIPGVGLGFHSDPTKSTQYSPQIAGGNGRNVNYQIDGGDNNDDTVGGLLQLFPLEAIQEFNFVTQRYKAEYGRSNGGVMNIVTKSGTNQMRGSWFTNFRDDSINSQTMTEKINKVSKQPYRRYQYGGSFGGPVVQNRAHFFAAYERTQQDTQQAVTTLGLDPSLDGVYPTPSRENLFTGKVSANLTATQFASVRYGRNTNSQVYAAAPRLVPENWGDSANTFNSINVNHNWVLGGSKLNEFVFQYADFENHILSRTDVPQQTFPNGVAMGYNTNTPQTTAQHKYQFRDDFSWHVTGKGGLGHDMKAGANFIHEPKLYVTFSSGSADYAYTHLTNDFNGPISRVTRNKPGASANLPMDQYGLYIQDDWRVTDRLTINAGLRYDLVTGFLIDQSAIPNYIALTGAAAAGRFDGVPGFDEFGKKAQEDKNNWQPRIGGVYDLRGDGRDIVRAGWGIYYDYGFTNANILFPGLSAQGGSGVVFDVNNTAGIKNSGRQLLHGRPADQQHRLAQRGQPQRAVLQLERGGAADPAAVHEADVGRLVARVLAHDGARHRLHPRGGQGPRRALAAQHAHSRSRRQRSAPLCRSGAEPGQPDDEHEHRRVHLQRHQLRHPPAHVQRHSDECVVHAGEGQGPRRPGGRRADHQPRAGFAQPAGRRAARPGRPHRCAAQGHAERHHPGAVGHHRGAGLPLPVGAADAHLVRLRQQPRRRQQRHLPDRVPVQGRR